MNLSIGIWRAHECHHCQGDGVVETGDGPNAHDIPCPACRRADHAKAFAAETEARISAARHARTGR